MLLHTFNKDLNDALKIANELTKDTNVFIQKTNELIKENKRSC